MPKGADRKCRKARVNLPANLSIFIGILKVQLCTCEKHQLFGSTKNLMHHKRGKRRNIRAGCKMCKYWKVNGFSTERSEGEKHSDHSRRHAESDYGYLKNATA